MVSGMRPGLRPVPLHHAIAGLLVTAWASCGQAEPYDWRNRDVDWTYGPTNPTARAEHLRATGTKGGAAIAEGWKVRLSDASRLTVRPYRLAQSHPLFGEVVMSISLFDRDGKRLETVQSEAVTATNATFAFDVSEDLARSLYDVVIWFREP